ncbi:SAM-dependent methyltransferase [Shewanella algae]|uniref:SAM-dependent methyltransferase n=1 Tax=Shewanella algae TaxID=38313 RepID=UPI001182C2A3|nr:SAM-dependent methyltransferase [Shewanella algae]MBO2617308.1 hypothetical protein [Shewanella algae]MCE9778610.1 SAM-dependent methyltransferase [Shewanella algae]MCE9826193.1 SAM-dependent methyltransferase [Shewanella algae]TVL56907.1 hypothetical protein AYJ00_14395 [Shewanella algae]
MQGSITCVGVGMMLGAHLSPVSLSHIEQADIVFCGVSDPLVELWLKELNANVRSLQPCYAHGKSRHLSYREMVDTMLSEVRLGKKVVGAFYGHPGVFAKAPHQAVTIARNEGFEAQMLPGISAADCLYADLGIDPGQNGCQHFEATQFMLYHRRVDPTATLILWQIGLAGDLDMGLTITDGKNRQLLLEELYRLYSPEHSCWLYEAATTALASPRREAIKLRELVEATLALHTTLVIPPAAKPEPNLEMRARLAALGSKAPLYHQPEESV